MIHIGGGISHYAVPDDHETRLKSLQRLPRTRHELRVGQQLGILLGNELDPVHQLFAFIDLLPKFRQCMPVELKAVSTPARSVSGAEEDAR
ncbi:hypothetical protein D3C81_1236430 [compost metagenome]